MKDTHGFSVSRDSARNLLKNGKPFFVNPIANGSMAVLNVGCIIPVGQEEPSFYQAGWASGKIIVGTGDCCEGFVIALTDDSDRNSHGQIAMIQAIDFNVHCLNPIIFNVEGTDQNGAKKLFQQLGFLATGAGCSGSGVRFVHFRPIPQVIPIVPSSEKLFTNKKWFHTNPLTDIDNIWERLEKNGIAVDRALTVAAQREFTFLDFRKS